MKEFFTANTLSASIHQYVLIGSLIIQDKIQVHIIFLTEIHGFPASVLSELDREIVHEFPPAMVGNLAKIRAENILTGINMQVFSFLL